MTETQRQWAVTLMALIVLLGMTAMGNDKFGLVGSVLVLVTGFIALPRDRGRGAVAALVGVCAAAAISAIAALR